MAALRATKELLVKVGYGNISCKVWGDNIPTTQKFLGLHGWSDNAGSFDPLMEYFVNTDRCIVCVDMPGHGLSNHHPQGIPYSPASDLQAIRSVVRNLGWQKYNLLGHSVGVIQSQTYAMCWPGEIQSVIALDGCIIPDHLDCYPVDKTQVFTTIAQQTDKALDLIANSHRKNRERTWDELCERWLASAPGLEPEDFAVLMKRGATKLENGNYVLNRDPVLHNHTLDYFGHSEEILMQAVKKLSNTPQFIMNFTNFYIPDKLQHKYEEVFKPFIERLTANYPNKFEVVKFEGSHHVHMQRPAEIAALINNFLAEVNEQSSPVTPLANL